MKTDMGLIQALTLIGVAAEPSVVEHGETKKRRVSDIGWGGWAILATIITPAMVGAFLAGKAVSAIATLDTRLTHELEVRDLKINYVYTQMTLGERFTAADGKRLETMIEAIGERSRRHIENAGPLIQKLDILWARAGLDREGVSE